MAIASIDPLVEAMRNKLQVTLVYLKKTTGEIVTHTGGIYEINANDPTSGAVLWLWDTTTNDKIRKFLIGNIQSFQVLQTPFQTNGIWPLKLNGQELGY